MRLLPANTKGFGFLLNPAECHLFTEVLGQYPAVPASHHTLSKSLDAEDTIEDEHLLHEALAEHRATLKQRIAEWLAAPGRWRNLKQGTRLTIPRDDVEWLLQVLNDVRVGSWVKLGSPELHLDPNTLPPEQQATWAMMELGGAFQMALLGALERDPNP
jgi:hypothetical protein